MADSDRCRPRPSRAGLAARIEWLLTALGVAALVAAPFFFYPVFLMKMLCFALFACAFNLLLGYTGLLSFGHAAFFGGAAYFTAHAVKEWGLAARARHPRRHRRRRAPRPRHRLLRHPPPGHLLRDDHAGAGADVLLLLPAGALHPRRGRHPGRAARPPLRLHRPRRSRSTCTTSCSRCSCSASSPSGASSTRPSA